MEEVGCFSKLIKGGSYVLLGRSTLISAVEIKHAGPVTLYCTQKTLNDLPKISSNPTVLDPNSVNQNIIKTPSSIPFKTMISLPNLYPSSIDICNKYLHVFSQQESVLPLHRYFDLSIAIKEVCKAPFSGLYNLSLDVQIEFKQYFNDLLKKVLSDLRDLQQRPRYFLLKFQAKRTVHV